jgi:hypothetical protein
VSAAAAAVMMFAVATAPESTLFPGTQSPFVASAARRAPPVDENRGSPAEDSSTYVAPQTEPPLPGMRAVKAQVSGRAVGRESDPPISGHMR